MDTLDENKFNALDDLEGIDEWYINNTENIIVIKYDQNIIENEESILQSLSK